MVKRIYCSDCSLFFGVPDEKEEPPRLPEGWIYWFDLEEFALLESPSGKKYYLDWEKNHVCGLARKQATFWDFIRTMGKLPRGSFYMDDKDLSEQMKRGSK